MRAQPLQHVATEVKMTGVKLVGGAVTYAGSKEVAKTALDIYVKLDPVAITQWASAVAAIMTALYFAAQLGYTFWKWRKEAKRGR